MKYRIFAFVAACCSWSSVNAVDPVPFLPADTDVVITFQSKQILESELLQKIGGDLIKTVLKASKQANEAVEASGVDVLKDFERIVVGINVNQTNPLKPLVLMEGKFDPKKVADSVTAYSSKNPNRIKPITISDKPAYQVGTGNEALYSAVISESLLVIAPSEAAMTGAFQAAAGTRKPVITKELAGLLATTKSTAPVYIQAWVKGKFASVNVPNDQLKQRLQGVDWATASATITKDVTLNGVLNAADAAAAKQLSDLLGGVVVLLKLQVVAAAEDQPELKPVVELLRTVKVVPKDRTVVITGSVKGAEIEKALLTPPKK